jgi:hypothetical protein
MGMEYSVSGLIAGYKKNRCEESCFYAKEMDDVDFRESIRLCTGSFECADAQGCRTRMGYDRRHKRERAMLESSRAALGYAAWTT